MPARSTIGPRAAAALAVLVAVVMLAAPVGGVEAATPTSAPTRDLERAEAADLVEAAISSEDARTELSEVETIDGEPFDAEAVLSGSESDVAGRLTEMHLLLDTAHGPGRATGSTPDAEEAGERARQILDGDRFAERSVPRPFRSAFRWLSDRLADAYEPIERALAPLVGAAAVPYVVVAAFVLATALLTRRLAASRSRAATVDAGSGTYLVDPATDPAELEARAAEAGARGDRRSELRLLHQAGLLRLMGSGRLELRPAMTARGAADEVGEPALDELTDLFEAVVYGEYEPDAADLERCRHAWASLLGERVR